MACSRARSTSAWSTAQAVSVLSDDRYRVPLAIVALACLLGFLGVATLVFAGTTTALDTTGLESFRGLHGTPLDPVFVAISEFGVANILAFFSMITAGFLWAAGARRASIYIVVGYVAAAAISDAIKSLFPLARPPVTYQIPLRMSETEDWLWIIFAIALVVSLWRTRWRWGAVIGAVLFATALFWDPAPLSTPGIDSTASRRRAPSITNSGWMRSSAESAFSRARRREKASRRMRRTGTGAERTMATSTSRATILRATPHGSRTPRRRSPKPTRSSSATACRRRSRRSRRASSRRTRSST